MKYMCSLHFYKKSVLTEKELMVAITARGGCLHNTRVHSKRTTAIQVLSSWVSYCCPLRLVHILCFRMRFGGKYSLMTVSTNQQKFAYQTTDLCLLLKLTYFLSAISHLPQEIPAVWKFWPHLSDVHINRVFDGSVGMKVYLHLHFYFR